MVIFEALFGCNDIIIFGRSPINWRQRPNMAIAVDLDVKHQFKHASFLNIDEIQLHLGLGANFF